MHTNADATLEHTKTILSTLWVFVMFNYVYCDVIGLMDSGYLKQILSGSAGGMAITPGFLLAAGLLMEIPTAMVLLSRVLGHRANRSANIVAACLMTIVQVATLFFGSGPTIYYTFFSVIEIACTAFIVWYAWRWRSQRVEAPPVSGQVPSLQL